MKTVCGIVSLGLILLVVMGFALIGRAAGYVTGLVSNPQVLQQNNRAAGPIVDISNHLEFINPEPVVIRGHDGFMDEPFISRDGQYLFFNDPRTIFYAKKITDTTFQFLGQVQGLNTSAIFNGVPSMDKAGNFYFLSTINPRRDHMSIYHGTFNDGMVTNISAVAGIPGNQAGVDGMDQEISADGRILYHTSSTSTTSTFEIAVRNVDGSFTKLANSDDLLKNINADNNRVYAPDISSDGLELYYTAINPTPGIHVAKRSSTSEPFGMPRLVATADETVGLREAPSISPDGTRLYYGQQRKIPGVRMFLMQIYVLTRAGASGNANPSARP